MTVRRKPKKAVADKTVHIRHQYRPGDQIKDDKWKDLYPLTEPMTVTLDVGTFQWLWDFVDRKGFKADSGNFQVYSPILKETYQRAADQFAVAAREAFGDTYKVETKDKDGDKQTEAPAEAPESAPKRRRKRRAPDSTAKTFGGSKSVKEPSEGNDQEKPRSRRRKRPKK